CSLYRVLETRGDLSPPPLSGGGQGGGTRYLLRDAVNIAPAQEDFARRYSDHTAIWEQALQRLQRNRIGFAIEQRHDDSRVCDVEIDVRGGETFSWNARPTVFDGIDTTAFLGCSEQGTRHWQLVYLEPAALGIARIRQALVSVPRDLVLRIALVVSPGQHDFARTHEAAEIVDVPARFVVHHASAQPNHLGDTKIFAKQVFNLCAIQVWIAVWIEQAFFGGKQRAFAVDVNCTTLQHERRTVAVAALDLEHFARHQIVLIPGKIQPSVQPSPCIEDPVDATDLAGIVHHERRSDIAHPRIVARQLHDANRIREHGARIHVLFA